MLSLEQICLHTLIKYRQYIGESNAEILLSLPVSSVAHVNQPAVQVTSEACLCTCSTSFLRFALRQTLKELRKKQGEGAYS